MRLEQNGLITQSGGATPPLIQIFIKEAYAA